MCVGEGGELRTHSKPQSREERRQRRAAPSPALPPSSERSLGLRGGPGIPGAASREGFAPRPGALLSAAPAGPAGVCVPRPPPHGGGSHLCPAAGAGGAQAAPHAPAPAQRRGGRASSPLRTAPGRGQTGGCSPGVCASPSPPSAGRGSPEEGGPGGCDRRHPGLGQGELRVKGCPAPGDVTRGIPAWGRGDSE